MEIQEIVESVDKIVSLCGLYAEIPPNIRSVGVGGDERTYLPCVFLVGPFPGWKILAELSTEITNTLPVNRVTYELLRKKEG